MAAAQGAASCRHGRAGGTHRLYLGEPTQEEYAQIFQQYAKRPETAVSRELSSRLLERYRARSRELRWRRPRDLIERARDICRFEGWTFELTAAVPDLAWTGYFGDQ
jgi:hypothetical protein